MSHALVPDAIRTMPNGRPGVAAFDADGVLWHGDIAEDFVLWGIGEGCFDGSLWPVYQRCNAEDPTSGALQLPQFFAGLEVARLRALVETFWQTTPARRWLLPVRATLRWARDHGLRVLVVSATPTPVLAPLRRHLPVDAVIGMDLEVEGRRLTGRVAGVPTVGDGKAARIHALGPEPVLLAAGNSRLDIPMLAASEGIAWAINPDPGLRTVAQDAGWLITEEPEQ